MSNTGRVAPDIASTKQQTNEAVPSALTVIAKAAQLLFVNGETTEATRVTVAQLGEALGRDVLFLARWGELSLSCEDERISLAAEPVSVDMGKVAATTAVVDSLCEGSIDKAAAFSSLEAIARSPPVALGRFAVMAAAGAAALGIIFGAVDAPTLVLIAISAGAGACLRRGLAHLSLNPFVQPLAAALLAGLVGGASAKWGLDAGLRLVVVCPCMMLVPGPHFLNGSIDLARARIPLGAARIAFASLVVLMISGGLLMGLWLTINTFAVEGPASRAPLLNDVVAAGVAVAAYGSFFNMPWRMLPLPIGLGMLAHAARWELLEAGASLHAGAFIACLIVGIVATPLADRLRVPFGAFAFAAVVSLIPGVFMFQTASALVALINAGKAATSDMLLTAAANGITAFIVILVMTIGIIVPKMGIEHVRTLKQGLFEKS